MLERPEGYTVLRFLISECRARRWHFAKGIARRDGAGGARAARACGARQCPRRGASCASRRAHAEARGRRRRQATRRPLAAPPARSPARRNIGACCCPPVTAPRWRAYPAALPCARAADPTRVAARSIAWTSAPDVGDIGSAPPAPRGSCPAAALRPERELEIAQPRERGIEA